jgi:TonB family protein
MKRMMTLRLLRKRKYAAAFLILASLVLYQPLWSQKPSAGPAPTIDSATSPAQNAVHAVIQQNVLDPNVVVASTKASLPATGKWAVGTKPVPECPDPAETCLLTIYNVPEAGVSCQWVVKLQGSSGVIVSENADAARYFLRRIDEKETKDLVKTRKNPVYPPIAEAAHVQGTVVLSGVVSDAGAVISLYVVSGPDMLKGAAMDAGRQWTFAPLKTGDATPRYQVKFTFNFYTSGPGRSRITVQP